MLVSKKIIKSMPDIIKESNEPVNLCFVLDSKSWRKTLREIYSRNSWIEGVTRIYQEGKITVISYDEISQVESNDLAFAGNNDYMNIPIDSKYGFFDIRIPFSRDHFRVWRYRRDMRSYYIKGSGTYDFGFRVYDIHVEEKNENIEELYTKFKNTINRSKNRSVALGKLRRIEIGHLVTEFTRTRLNAANQYSGKVEGIKKANEQWLNPTGKKVLWTGLLSICA